MIATQAHHTPDLDLDHAIAKMTSDRHTTPVDTDTRREIEAPTSEAIQQEATAERSITRDTKAHHIVDTGIIPQTPIPLRNRNRTRALTHRRMILVEDTATPNQRRLVIATQGIQVETMIEANTRIIAAVIALIAVAVAIARTSHQNKRLFPPPHPHPSHPHTRVGVHAVYCVQLISTVVNRNSLPGVVR